MNFPEQAHDTSTNHPSPGPALADQDDFEALALADALPLLMRAPRKTVIRFWQVLTRAPGDYRRMPDPLPDPVDAGYEDDDLPPDELPDYVENGMPLLVYAGAILLALIGGWMLHSAATDPAAHSSGDTNGALAWFAGAGVLLVIAEVWRARFVPALSYRLPAADRESPPPAAVPAVQPAPSVYEWLEAHIFRLALLPLALILTILTYQLNVARDVQDRIMNVQITTPGFLAWALSIALWIAILGVDGQRFGGEIHELPRRFFDWRLRARRWPLLILLLITLGGLAFRLHDLTAVPPEMTSDHIEKLLDGLRVYEGDRSVFFPNNGGREGFQMVVVALIGGPLGVGFNFDALKIATVIEGVITLPVLWWMARQVIGTETEAQRRLGNWIGLALAGLVAVSAWHLMLSRLGLRIVLTPLTTALVIGFLARAMRHNRTADFLALGFTLGAGIYFYQANRMLPLLAVAGIALAVLAQMRRREDVLRIVTRFGVPAVIVLVLLAAAFGLDTLIDADVAGVLGLTSALLLLSLAALAARAAGEPAVRYVGGLLAAAVIALALYVPMFRYSELYPDQFWNRTRGRLFGEESFVRTDPATGFRASYEPALREQIERFWEQRATFADNYADALRMAHWEGDAAWISNAHGAPALDGITGGLVLLGVMVWGLWVIQAVRRRDWMAAAILLLLPVSIAIMLLPSAMTLAYTIENPSFTRASGTIPPVFMLAALPVGAFACALARWQLLRVPVGYIVALGGLAILVVASIPQNSATFFTDYRLSYSHSWKPYREIARPIHDFAAGEGSYGNAFMVAYPHWLDHRILGAMAGDLRWPNGLVRRDDLFEQIRRNQGTRYEYDPDKPIVVMYHLDDSETARYLDEMLPGGTHFRYDYRYETLRPGQFETGAFTIYTVSAGEIDRPADDPGPEETR